MKKFLSLIALASLFVVSCGEKPEPDPTPSDETKLELASDALSAEATVTSATITVTANCAWKAESDNPAFTLNPSSGNGNGTITVTFPANENSTEVKAVITITTDGVTPEKTVKVTITQAAAEITPEPEPGVELKNPQSEGLLAEWVFCTANLAYFEEHFAYDVAKDKDADGNFVAGKPGYVSDDHYCPATSGSGRLRMLNVVDKSSPTVNPKGAVKRGTGNYGEPCFYGPLNGDVVNIYAYPAESFDGFAAGTKIHIFFALRPNTKNTPKYWKLEIKDGDKWAPVGEVKKGIGDPGEGEIEYNIELIFNPAGQGMQPDEEGNKTIYPDVPQQINTFIDETYTLTSAVSEIEYRLTCTANLGADGYTSAYPVGANGNAVLRFAGKDSNSGGAHPVEDPMKIEIVE